MVNYKDLGLVNTRDMFAKAIKGGYAIPAFNFNIIENLVDDVAIPERERISFNTKIVKAVLADGTEIPMDMRINMSDGSWLGGLIDKEVTLKDGSTTQVQDCLTGHVDFVNNTTSISSASFAQKEGFCIKLNCELFDKVPYCPIKFDKFTEIPHNILHHKKSDGILDKMG